MAKHLTNQNVFIWNIVYRFISNKYNFTFLKMASGSDSLIQPSSTYPRLLKPWRITLIWLPTGDWGEPCYDHTLSQDKVGWLIAQPAINLFSMSPMVHHCLFPSRLRTTFINTDIYYPFTNRKWDHSTGRSGSAQILRSERWKSTLVCQLTLTDVTQTNLPQPGIEPGPFTY